MNVHHHRAFRLAVVVLALDLALGAAFGAADRCGTWDGLYFAIVTVTTVGYGDVTPHGWAAHAAALAIILLVIPLWASVFSLVTTGFTADHVDRRHEEVKDEIRSSR